MNVQIEIPESISDFSMSLSASQLLEKLQERFNQDAQDYNELADAYEALQLHVQQLTVSEANLKEQLAEQTSRADSLAEGNKLLMEARRELTKKLERAALGFEKAHTNELKWKQRAEQFEQELKALKKLGDPTKLITQNKTLREKNVDIQTKLGRVEQARQALAREMKDLARNGGDYHYLPSFTSDEGENVYIHPKRIDVIEQGEKYTKIALTHWTKDGIGRVVTWNGTDLLWASFGHKTVNSKFAPSQAAIDFAKGWFEKHVVPQGRVQAFRSDYQVKKK